MSRAVEIRAHADLAARQREQQAFHASTEWREGPRDAVPGMIDEYLSVLMEPDETAIDGRRNEDRPHA